MMLARHMMTLTPERRTEFVGRLESLIHEFGDDEESDETEPFGLLIIAHPQLEDYDVRQLFGIRDYRLLWTGQAVSPLGTP